MEIFVTDWRDFTWFMFSWSEVSHPAISIRFRWFNWCLALIYFRIRPWSYLHGPAYVGIKPTDSRFVIDLPTLYRWTDV